MTRLILLMLSTLLALLSVVSIGHAKDDELIRSYTFSTDACSGPPQAGNVDLKRDQCHNVPQGARSVKPFKHRNLQWLHDINNGGQNCEVIGYVRPGCIDGEELTRVKLPEGIQKCLSPAGPEPVYSLKFVCHPKGWTTTVTDQPIKTYTTTVVATSWSFGQQDEKPTPYASTNTLTFTYKRDVVEQSQGSSAHHVEPRATNQRDHKGVWMFHPWSRSVICYDCCTKKKNDNRKFECRSGANNPINCGPRPVGNGDEPGTVTTHVTQTFMEHTATVSPTETITLSLSLTTATATHTVGLEERSWHRRVTFEHPFVPGTDVCADAEWEKRGDIAKQYIKLQHIGTDFKKCNKAINNQNNPLQHLNVPKPIVLGVGYRTTISSGTTTLPAVTQTIIIQEVGTMHGDISDDDEPQVANVPLHTDL